jgi:DNA-binding NarL/FixJ family response regulator
VPCGIILFASAIAEDQVLEAYRLGARGFLLKSMPVELIGECVRKVARGERWIEQNSAERVIERVAGGAAARKDGVLTSRERQIGKLAATGLRNREIADRLGISVGTVKVHLHNVYRKLGVRGRVQLATYARTRGFV